MSDVLVKVSIEPPVNVQVSPLGQRGLSAYEVAVADGFVGTESEWLASLQGVDGKSAYQAAQDAGFDGSEADFNASLMPDFAYFEKHWSEAPTQITTLDTGAVLKYVHKGVTRYRHVPEPYDATQDAFYSSFDGTTLSGLLAARG